MRFCKDCGTKIVTEEVFCSKCGVSIDAKDVSGINSLEASSLKGIQNTWGKNFKLFVATIVLLVLSPLLTFFDTILIRSTSFLGVVTETGSTFDLFRLLPALMIFPVILGILLAFALISLFIPLVKGREYTSGNFVFSKIYSISLLVVNSLIFIGFFTVGAFITMTAGATMRLTVWGYLYFIANIALIVVLFKLSSKYKVRK